MNLPDSASGIIRIKSEVGEPASIEPETYMTRIHDFFHIFDDYDATTGEVFGFDGGWDQHDATLALLHQWEAEADVDEYWHGVYKYPRDGSSCGYAFTGRPMSIAAGVDDGCAPNSNAHEVGHSLSLRHPRDGCGAANADQGFPYDNAGIGPRRGWLLSASRFVNPDDGFADTMSYCGPEYYISDYHYRKAFDHLRASDDDSPDTTLASVAAALPVRESTDADGQAAAHPSPIVGSLVFTGEVDAWGTWSLRWASLSAKRPKPSARPARSGRSADAYVLVLVPHHICIDG